MTVSRPSRLLAWLAAKLLACALAIFVLLAVLAPNLVNLHRDLALAGALACLALSIALALFAARAVVRAGRRIARARREVVLPPLNER